MNALIYAPWLHSPAAIILLSPVLPHHVVIGRPTRTHRLRRLSVAEQASKSVKLHHQDVRNGNRFNLVTRNRFARPGVVRYDALLIMNTLIAKEDQLIVFSKPKWGLNVYFWTINLNLIRESYYNRYTDLRVTGEESNEAVDRIMAAIRSAEL